MKAAARRKAMGTTATARPPTKRKATKKSVAESPAVLTGSDRLIADLLDTHFAAYDRLIAAECALVLADHEERKTHALFIHAVEESRTGTAAHQAEWLGALESLDIGSREAHLTVVRARFERDEARLQYDMAKSGLLSTVALL